MKLVIVEDEPGVRAELVRLLEDALYEVVAISRFTEIPEQILRAGPDLVLLDIGLPRQDGGEICRRLRERSRVPIIFLTSDSTVMTELSSMLAGGDDYITKPYHPSVLLARIAAVLKRSRRDEGAEAPLLHKGVSLDLRTYRATCGDRDVELTKNECKLLHYLYQRRGEVVPRLDIVEYLWDNQVYVDDNALSVNITRLRGKLEEIGARDFIQTKRGVGYQI